MKKKHDPTTRINKQPMFVIVFVGLFFFLLLILLATIFPTYSGAYFLGSAPFGVIGLVSLIWLQVNPNLYARFFSNASISCLCTLIAWRAFGDLFPDAALLGNAVITSVVLLVYTFPMWNSKSANFIREELSAPKTKIGKTIFRLALLFVPIAGAVTAGISMILYRNNKLNITSSMFLLVFLFLAIILPFASRSPSSPWETR